MARTFATASQGELPEGLKSYLQLFVNDDVVLREFLAHSLNTPLGHALRQSTMQGTTICRISKRSLADSTLHLPPLDDQRKALDAIETIRQLRNELGELEACVWDRPRHVDDVLEALSNVNHKE